MGILSLLSLKLRGLNRYTAVLIAFFMSSALLATSTVGTAFAAGENYTWEDKETIVATDGTYNETHYFSKGKGILFPFSSPPQLIDMYVLDDPITTSDGCFIKLGIQLSGSDKERGTLRRIADPITDGLASNHCPESYSLARDYATNIRLGNAPGADAAPSTVITVTIRSLVPDGEDFPGEGDTFTLKLAGQDKVLVSKKAGEKHAYTKDGMTGYERTFKFKTTPDRKFYQACSAALDKCTDGDSTALSDLLGGAVGVFLFEIVKEDEGEVVCSAGALGWVLCPVMKIMADTTEWVAGQLEDYLAFNPFSGAGNEIRTLWGNILNVANVMLVIAFLAVIFSQSTSVGLSSYGIKRMLPRIIAAAILMNLSYYICQILIDISNIAGVGITSLVSAASSSTFSENVADVGVVSTALTATAIVAVILFFFLIPVVLAFLAIFFTLAARNAIIVLLVIVAPLAFAAWILPNTEKYFKKWWELFINMLILYPMVMLIFSASIVAANVIQTSGTPSDAEGSGELKSIIALIVLALPLFAMPLLFKTASGALGRINAMTKQGLQRYGGGDLANKGMQAMRGSMKDKAGTIARERQARIAERFGQGYEATGRGRRTRTALGKSVGFLASGQVRKQGWDARKANAESTFKTLYEERGATDATSRAAVNAERKFELDQRTAGAHQLHSSHLSQRTLEDDAFARAAAGVTGEAGVRRVQAAAISQDRDESRKRSAAIQQLLSRQEETWQAQGLDFRQVLGQYNAQYADAASRGDHEVMSAILKQVAVKGGSGRNEVAKMLETHAVQGAEAQKRVEETVFQELSLPQRADVTKGSMGTDGTWKIASATSMGSEQIAKLDKVAMERAINQGEISQGEALRILSNENLKEEIQNRELEILLEGVAYGPGGPPPTPPPTPPTPPTPPPAPSGGGTP